MAVITNFTEESVRNLTDEELKKFIPDVYQKDISDIDYKKLWDKGIKLISFDIDDTLIDMMGKFIDITPQQRVIDKLKEIKAMGFTIILLTNASEENAGKAFEKLNKEFNTNGCISGYVCQAKKPNANGFQKALDIYGHGLKKENMAHVGNSMRKDIQGGNDFDITTCLVKDSGILTPVGLMLEKKLGINSGHFIRHELKRRGMWSKHHIYRKNDQYYQLGETSVIHKEMRRIIPQ